MNDFVSRVERQSIDVYRQRYRAMHSCPDELRRCIAHYLKSTTGFDTRLESEIFATDARQRHETLSAILAQFSQGIEAVDDISIVRTNALFSFIELIASLTCEEPAEPTIIIERYTSCLLVGQNAYR